MTPDRLGSIGKYFPYGQERPSATTDGKEKFATYFRDSETGFDYADQRYHQPGMGRFMTADAAPSASASDPGSWNRYAYVGGDPINYFDPRGQIKQAPGTPGADDGLEPGPDTIVIQPGPDPFSNLPKFSDAVLENRFHRDLSGIQRASGSPLGTSSAGALRAATTAQNAVANRTEWRGSCEQLLGAIGVTSSAISFAASDAVIYDGTSGFSGDILMADLYLNTPLAAAAQAEYLNTTVAQYIAKQAKIGKPVKAVAGLNRDIIFINPTYWGGSSADDFATVMHELIHNATGLNDAQLGEIVNGNFSDALKRDCF